MNWDSEATSKHIAEAEAQGCKLLGPGRDRHRRLYQLECGHEKEAPLKSMRIGEFRCQTCFDKRLTAEAEAQGCKLLGAGRSKHYRLYQLDCGHEQEVRISSMRVGSPRCQPCVENKHIVEAEAQGCKLLGAGSRSGYRTYQLPCGHEREVQSSAMRRGEFRCQTCLDKRLIDEAEAQGCKLLGPGRSAHYRLYQLDCGHEQEVDTGKMRSGGFRCQTCQPCVENKHSAEAEAQGCKLLGPGRNRNHRLYQLECGHEQEVHTGEMRKGSFRCRTCLDKRFIAEAESQGCKLLRAGGRQDYRVYQLPCGHEQEVTAQCMRIGQFRCQTCLDERLIAEAEAQGCKLLGAGRIVTYRLYQLDCGHEQEVQLMSMRKGTFHCQTCFDDRLASAAEVQGCELLGPGRNHNYRLYQLDCGHEQEVTTQCMRIGKFRCQICLDDKHSAEAEAQGCKLLGMGSRSGYRTYQLECGHEQEVKILSMRIGTFCCQTCEESSRTQPSNIYLFHIQVADTEWLKLGYAKNIDYRAGQYGLPDDTVIKLLAAVPVDTGAEAHALESHLHTEYRDHLLSSRRMKKFHTKSGYSECYPVSLMPNLLSELGSPQEA